MAGRSPRHPAVAPARVRRTGSPLQVRLPASIVAVVLTPRPLVQAVWWTAPRRRLDPLVIAPPGGRILAVCPRAARHGVMVGHSVAQARLRCPDVGIALPDPTTAAALWDEALRALSTVSPTVEATDPEEGLAYLDARGLERLWGDTVAVARQALRALEARDLRAQAGAGATRLVARALAHGMGPDGPLALEGDAARQFIQALPVDAPALALPRQIVTLLRELGTLTASDLARLPAAGIGLRFGAEGLAAWRAVTGTREPPLRPWSASATIAVTHQEEDGIADGLALQEALAGLSHRLSTQLAAQGHAVSLLSLQLMSADGARLIRHTRLWPPRQIEPALADAARDLLAALRPDTAIESVTLLATDLHTPAARQQGLWTAQGKERRSGRLDTILAAHARQYGRVGLRRLHRDPNAPDGWRWEAVEQSP